MLKVNSQENRATAQVQFTYLIHETLTDQSKLNEVWIRFCLLKGGTCLPRSTFNAWLLNNGNGRFPLDYLPILCQAMRDCDVDPDPIINLLGDACLPPIETDGSVLDEFLLLSEQMGQVAKFIDSGELADMTRTQHRLFMQTVSKMGLLCRRMSTEIHHHLTS